MHVERLLKLAEHLEGGKLSVSRFNILAFRTYCGTAGCALGECPTVFPDDWEMRDAKTKKAHRHLIPALRGIDDYNSSFLSAARFFDITPPEVYHLFFHNHQMCDEFGGHVYTNETTASDVAFNIRELINKRKEAA